MSERLSSFEICLPQETQFSVKLEASSPGGGIQGMGEEQDASPSKLSKEELIQSMDRVDREIAKVEQQIFKLKKKQVRRSKALLCFPSFWGISFGC